MPTSTSDRLPTQVDVDVVAKIGKGGVVEVGVGIDGITEQVVTAAMPSMSTYMVSTYIFNAVTLALALALLASRILLAVVVAVAEVIPLEAAKGVVLDDDKFGGANAVDNVGSNNAVTRILREIFIVCLFVCLFVILHLVTPSLHFTSLQCWTFCARIRCDAIIDGTSVSSVDVNDCQWVCGCGAVSC